MSLTEVGVRGAAAPEEDDEILVARGRARHKEGALFDALALSNGVIEVRPVLGERFGEPATFFTGLFDPPEGPRAREAPEWIPELIAAPSWLSVGIEVDGAPLRVDEESLTRTLDLRRALVRVSLRSDGAGLSVVSEQRTPPGAVVQRVFLTIDRPATLSVESPLLAASAARAAWPAARLVCTEDSTDDVLVACGAQGAGLVVARQLVRVSSRGGDVAIRRVRVAQGLVDRARWVAEPGQTYILERTVSVATSPRCEVGHAMGATARAIAPPAAASASELVRAHDAHWADRWRTADVRIHGDPLVERAVRFAIFHLLSSAGPSPLPSRLHAAGAYRGHVMWDCDTFALPLLTFTWPDAARAVLSYRHRTLGEARAKAARLGFRGALYAWESALTGAEVTPKASHASGARVAIRTGDFAHHISADVAYAVWQYWCATGDEAFMQHAGVEILVETARFWASRAALEADGRCHIRGVVGPDEYHDDVDDNAYTNVMARANLEYGARAIEWLLRRDPARARAVVDRIGLEAGEADDLREVASRLHPLLRDGRIESFAGWSDLEEFDARASAPARRSLQADLGIERLRGLRVAKQADAVLLCHLLGDRFDRGTIARTFDEYEPRTDPEGSSLSPAIYAAVAARLGRDRLARAYLERASDLGLGGLFDPPTPASSGRVTPELPAKGGGIHTAACGGIWQAVVFGALGVRAEEDALALSPRLLREWKRVEVALVFRGATIDLDVTREQITLRCGPAPTSLRARVHGREIDLVPGGYVAVPNSEPLEVDGG